MSFDDDYGKDGWRLAWADDLYDRLGLKPSESIDPSIVDDAHLKRSDWWKLKQSQYLAGKQMQIVQDVGPSCEKAINSLSEAKTVLRDRQKREEYDRDRAEKEAKEWREQASKVLDRLLRTMKKPSLTPEHRQFVLEDAREKGIPDKTAEEILKKLLLDKNVVIEEASSSPEPAPTVGNHYEILRLKRNATQEEIEEAYRREHMSRIKARDKTRADAHFHMVGLAYEALRDPVKRKEYDKTLSLPPPGTPHAEVSKTQFHFTSLRKGATASGSFTLRNTGGGLLEGSIRSNQPWLRVHQSKIDTNRHQQDIGFSMHTGSMRLGSKQTGTIEIQSNGGKVVVQVELSVEIERKALSRFRKTIAGAGFAAGVAMGLLLGTIAPDTANLNAGLAKFGGVLALVVVGAVHARFKGGCGALLGALIVLSILHALSPGLVVGVCWGLLLTVLLFVTARWWFLLHQTGTARLVAGLAVPAIALPALFMWMSDGLALSWTPEFTSQPSSSSRDYPSGGARAANEPAQTVRTSPPEPYASPDIPTTTTVETTTTTAPAVEPIIAEVPPPQRNYFAQEPVATPVERLLNSARRKLEAKDFPGALSACDEALKLEPHLDEAVVLKEAIVRADVVDKFLRGAELLLSKGDLKGALSQCDHVLTVSPGNPEATKLRETILKTMKVVGNE